MSGNNNTAFMDNLRQLFADCDSDKSGSLGRDEFKELCKRIGLNMGAAEETFERLDIDKNNQITFDEFVAGFQQYSKQSSTSPSPTSQHPPLSPSSQRTSPATTAATSSANATTTTPPQRFMQTSTSVANNIPNVVRTSRARISPTAPSPSPVGVLSVGNLSGNVTPPTNRVGPKTSSSSGMSSSLQTYSSSSSSFNIGSSSPGGTGGGESQTDYSSGYTENHHHPEDVVVYSSDLIDADQASGSGQFGSMLSTSSSTGYSQVKTMQDLLECVQKLQSENQALTQIFFKDKREREEYISQLGEEFDQQLKQVEERANRRAREELENEKKRLREMMQTERETLQNHYQTLEKITKLVKSPNGQIDPELSASLGLGGVAGGVLGAKGETIEKVKSQLEGTFEENRQLKRSLLDTKTDVAMIWKEMERLKKQYEEKLSSAYEKHKETQSECDHIKQQLTLMKDSNRKLQDASDVISNYITDKVEPVIKVASGVNLNDFDGEGDLKLNGMVLRANQSAANSRRGSILSEYLHDQDNEDEEDTYDENAYDRHKTNSRTRTISSGASLQVPQTTGPTSSNGGSRSQNKLDISATNKSDKKTASRAEENNDHEGIEEKISSISSSDNVSGSRRVQKVEEEKKDGKTNTEAVGDQQKQQPAKAQSQSNSKDQSKHSNQLQQTQQTTQTNTAIKNFGRNLLLGAKAQSDTKAKPGDSPGSNDKLNDTKIAKSVDQIDEPSVEAADGPSKATFNIILVGDSFVGKSSFAARFIEGSFVQGLISNCSIDFKTKSYKVDGQNYTVNLWDTA